MLIVHVIPPSVDVPKPCVQCDATLRALDKAGMVRGRIEDEDVDINEYVVVDGDYAVVDLDDDSRERFKSMDLISSPVVESRLLDDRVGGFRPDFIKRHVAAVEQARQESAAA